MATKKRSRKAKQQPIKPDFEAVLALPERLAMILRLLLKIDEATWAFCMDMLRQEGAAYREYSIDKGNGKRRHFAVPCDELKEVQKKILLHLLDTISTHFARYGVRGTSIMDCAEAHMGAQTMFATDIVNAFPSVRRSRVRKNLERPLRHRLREFGISFSEEDVFAMLDSIVDLLIWKDRLPQGPPSSPKVMGIVCRKLDMQLFGLAHGATSALQQYRFTAYADNLVLSSDGPITADMQERMLELVGENGFIAHTDPKKTTYFSPETGTVPCMLGLVVPQDGRVTMAPRKVKQIRARLTNLLRLEAWEDEHRMEAAGLLGFGYQIYPKGERKLPSSLRQPVEMIEARMQGATIDVSLILPPDDPDPEPDKKPTKKKRKRKKKAPKDTGPKDASNAAS